MFGQPPLAVRTGIRGRYDCHRLRRPGPATDLHRGRGTGLRRPSPAGCCCGAARNADQRVAGRAVGLAACPPNDRRSNQSGGTWVDVKMNQGSCVQCVTGWATSPVVGQARPDAQAKGATGESAGRGRAIVLR